HQVAIILNFVDFAFRAGSNSAPQSNDLRLGRVEDSVNRLDNFYLGVAGNFGHGCTLIKPVWGASLSTSTILPPAPDYYPYVSCIAHLRLLAFQPTSTNSQVPTAYQ